MKARISLVLSIVTLIFTVPLLFCGCKKDEGTLKDVTLNEVAHSIFYAPQYVAIENGYFEDEGINLKLVTGFGADKVMTALISGEAQTGLPDKALIDREITSLMTEQSETKRAAMIRDILTRIHDSAVYVPISYSRTKAVYRTSLSGVGFRVSQYEIPFEDMFFKDAK